MGGGEGPTNHSGLISFHSGGQWNKGPSRIVQLDTLIKRHWINKKEGSSGPIMDLRKGSKSTQLRIKSLPLPAPPSSNAVAGIQEPLPRRRPLS